MDKQSRWNARDSFVFFLSIVGVDLVGSISVSLILLLIGIDVLDPPFPITLVSIPIIEVAYLIVTLIFAKTKGAGLSELGFKKTGVKVFALVALLAFPLFILPVPISIVEEMLFGPDPMTEVIVRHSIPRDPAQLIVMIALLMFLVGPVEELAFRGFIQKGFENSFGEGKGLLISSLLFALLHGLNTLYTVIPVFLISLVLGLVWQRTGGNSAVSGFLHGLYDVLVIVVAFFAGV
jgi:membrane protease YdiL (CAAX protease family)